MIDTHVSVAEVIALIEQRRDAASGWMGRQVAERLITDVRLLAHTTRRRDHGVDATARILKRRLS